MLDENSMVNVFDRCVSSSFRLSRRERGFGVHVGLARRQRENFSLLAKRRKNPDVFGVVCGMQPRAYEDRQALHYTPAIEPRLH